MELRQIRAFVAVADRLHFGRAADQLGVAQPAVSQLVRRLETTLDLVLFERSSHQVALTASGAGLLPHARAVLEAVERMSGAAEALSAGTSGVLRLATTPGIGPRLGAVIGAYTAEHPDVGLELSVLDTHQKVRALREGRLDAAFFRSVPPVDRTLRRRVAWLERYVIVLPEGHRAAAQDPVDTAALADLPMLIVDRVDQPVMHAQLLEVCAAIGVSPRLRPSPGPNQDIIAMIAAGVGWMLYIEGNLPPGATGVAVRSLPPSGPRSTVWVVWPSAGTGAAAEEFLTVIARSGRRSQEGRATTANPEDREAARPESGGDR